MNSNTTLSKKTGRPVFRVKSGSKDKNVKFYIDTEYNGNKEPVKSYSTNGLLQLIPNKKGIRDVIYVSGISGVGKSTWVRDYASEYLKKYKSNNVIVISPKKHDIFDDIKCIRIKCNEKNFVDEPIDIKDELSDSLIVADDYESCDKPIRDGIINLLNKICIEGRQYNISLCIITHIFSNFLQTRTLLSESMYIVIFPGTSMHHFRQYCKNHIGLGKEQIDKIIACRSRWVCLHKNFPNFYLSSNEFNII